MNLVLLKRKGFARLALCTGAQLVPILGFGENDIYQTISHPIFEPLHRLCKATFKCYAPMFYGKEFLIFPARKPLVTVGMKA